MDFEKRRREQEMKLMRYTAGCTKCDYKINDDILKKLRLESVVKYIQEYQNKGINHLRRTSSDRIPKTMLHYCPMEEISRLSKEALDVNSSVRS